MPAGLLPVLPGSPSCRATWCLSTTGKAFATRLPGAALVIDADQKPGRADPPHVQHREWGRRVVDHGSTRMIRDNARFVRVSTLESGLLTMSARRHPRRVQFAAGPGYGRLRRAHCHAEVLAAAVPIGASGALTAITDSETAVNGSRASNRLTCDAKACETNPVGHANKSSATAGLSSGAAKGVADAVASRRQTAGS